MQAATVLSGFPKVAQALRSVLINKRGRLARALSLLLGFGLGLGLCIHLLQPGPPVRGALAQGVLLVNAAEVQFDDQSAPTSVTLPDTWAGRGLPSLGIARYRIHFSLDKVPDTLWALRAVAMSAHHEVRLNGHLVSGQAVDRAHLTRTLPSAQRILLPPALLKAGHNRLDLRLSYGSAGGLSQLEIGPAAALNSAHHGDVFRQHTLPITLNVGAMLASLAMLALRWRYRNDPLLGVLGWIALAGSLRNLLEFGTQGLPKVPAVDWAYLALQHLALVLGGVGANVVARDALRHWTRVTQISAAVLLIAAAISIPLGGFRDMRAASLGVIFALVLATTLAATRHLEGSRSHTRPTLLLALGLSLIAAFHDYLLRFGLIPMDHPEWTPLGIPLGLILIAWALLARSGRALRQSHALNSDLERRVRERTQDLQQANAAKSRFLASASHDLRQPVATIGLLVGLLRDQANEPRRTQMIDRVDQAVAAMEDLLKGLLDLSRLEAGTITPRRERVRLQRLFDAIASHEGETARQKGLKLRFRPTALAVTSDPVLLEQILRNLVNNAVRYTEHGGVLVACRRRSERLWIEVRDTGRGIPADRQAHVFEEFVQLDNQARDRSRGMGLGLAIVSRSAHLLGHRLRLSSTPGRGSCFSIELPPIAVAPARALSAELGDLTEHPLKGFRVALIEDDPGVRQALADRLQQWGGTVQAFEGHHALRARPAHGNERWADLIVSDQRLPDGTGIEAIDWIRAQQGATPAVLVTGDTDPADIARMNERNVPVLYKPFRAEALLQCIRHAMTLPGR